MISFNEAIIRLENYKAESNEALKAEKVEGIKKDHEKDIQAFDLALKYLKGVAEGAYEIIVSEKIGGRKYV
jgi:hypothetical protein